MTEIERKFLVDAVPQLGDSPSSALTQGYLAVDGDLEVRIRRDGDDCTLTVKKGRGVERAEVEAPLTADVFEQLWPLCGSRTLAKRRHRLAHDERIVEVDVYEGPLEGLVVAEMEFEDAAEAEAAVPPAWCGTEITGKPGWSNAELATGGRPAS